jgi:hypothetical protein
MFPYLKRAMLARAIVRGGIGLMILGMTGCVVKEYNSPPPPPPPPPQPAYVAPPPAPGAPDAPSVGAPPQDQVEVVGPAPGPDFVWLGGYWVWHYDHYDWVHGYWGHRPYAGAVWYGGHWEHHHHGWIFIGGYWR